MAKYYDVHNHLFNKDFLAKELLYRLMKEMRKMLHIEEEEEKDRGIRDSVKKLKTMVQNLRRFSNAIKIFTRKNSTAVYEELDKTYKGEFILTPLTFDLTYCFAPSADRDGTPGTGTTLDEEFDREMNAMFGMVEENTRTLSRDINEEASQEEDELWNEYKKEKEWLMKNADILKQQHKENIVKQAHDRGIDRDLIDLPDQFDGFEEQIKQLTELKNDPKYREMIYPFLAIDPRRPGIAEYAMQNVGKGKLFVGVKLYCPTGFSPTDPLLFGPEGEKGGIYAFCEENGIPVTVHCSDGGFATLSKSVVLNGLIHVNGQLIHVDNKPVTFKTTIFQKDAIYERAVTINHPLIWEKVAEKYPNLLLNLAHFGGGKQLKGALDNPDNPKLWSNRIIALLKDPRYKVYTDLSCYSDMEILRQFAGSPVFQEIKNRVLYGSDYTLLLLFENDFNENVNQFKEIFGKDFEIIAGKNAKEFLRNVI